MITNVKACRQEDSLSRGEYGEKPGVLGNGTGQKSSVIAHKGEPIALISARTTPPSERIDDAPRVPPTSGWFPRRRADIGDAQPRRRTNVPKTSVPKTSVPKMPAFFPSGGSEFRSAVHRESGSCLQSSLKTLASTRHFTVHRFRMNPSTRSRSARRSLSVGRPATSRWRYCSAGWRAGSGGSAHNQDARRRIPVPV